MRHHGQKEDVYLADGTIVIWRWLGFNRFFPADQPKPSKVMRGCASVRSTSLLAVDTECSHSLQDYQESCENFYSRHGHQSKPLFLLASFKLLSVVPISQLTRHLHVAYTLRNNYVIVLTLPDRVRLHNVSDFQPRQRPSFPLDENDEDDITNLSRLHLDEEGDDGEHIVAPIASQRAALSPPLAGQDIIIPKAECNLQAVSLSCHGLSLMVLGVSGRVWIWTSTLD